MYEFRLRKATEVKANAKDPANELQTAVHHRASRELL